MTTTTKIKRRTFKEVAREAYERGFAEGVEHTSKNTAQELENMATANVGLARSVMLLEAKLDKIQGSWITALRYWAKGHV